MKFLGLVFAVAALVASSAQAQGTRTIYQAELDSVNLDQKLSIVEGDLTLIKGGNVALDLKNKKATLTLYREFYCPPGVYCALGMPAPMIVELQIQTKYTDRCGNKVVVASDVVDVLPVVPDSRRVLTITDTRQNICPTFHFRPLEPTTVEYEYDFTLYTAAGEARKISTVSTMSGKALRALRVQ